MANDVLGKSLEDLGIEICSPISAWQNLPERLLNIAPEKLRPGQCQPRRNFTKQALKELADSIKAQGVVQPLVARPISGESCYYEIISGERRWRASQLAGLKEVPVVVRVMYDQTSWL